MPIYEYQCQKCGHHLEALQKFSDKPLRECPECGKHQLKRLMSAPLFRLAGSGWYETDFKSDKETQAQPRREGRQGAAGAEPRPRRPKPPAKPEAKAEPQAAREADAPTATKPAQAAGAPQAEAGGEEAGRPAARSKR